MPDVSSACFLNAGFRSWSVVATACFLAEGLDFWSSAGRFDILCEKGRGERESERERGVVSEDRGEVALPKATSRTTKNLNGTGTLRHSEWGRV